MKRELWTTKLSNESAPAWPCPACPAGTLALPPRALVQHETPASKALQGDENWEPDWSDYIFSAWLKCGNANCGCLVAVVGSGKLQPEADEVHGMVWSPALIPLFAYPMPDMFLLPEKCPPQITDPLRRAFASFWSNPTAAANSTRTSLEHLLDEMGVARKRKNKNGSYSTLKLHARIEELQRVTPAIGNQLMAVKWLGNTGSHESGVTHEDLLDAFEIVEYALDELIAERSKRIAKLAKSLSRKHAPKKK